MLNQLYSVMDKLAEHFNLYKIETVGDAYMCCSGLPVPDKYHAENIANFAIAVMECVKHVQSPVDGTPIQLRIGIHTGHCTAGVVGTLTPHYCLFGDMVNTTARHEQTGLPGMIQCSSDLFGRLKHFSMYEQEQFALTPRGLVSMKGKKECCTYWLEGGTANNERAGPAALQALSNDVSEMLEKKSWKMRRYFRRSGELRGDSETQSVGSHNTFVTTSSVSEESDQGERTQVTWTGSDDDDSIAGGESEAEVNLASEASDSRDAGELDDMLEDCYDPAADVENGLLNLVWEKTLSREDFVSNIHLLLSPLLNLCLFDSTTGQFPDNLDLLDGQLYGLIDRLSKSFKKHNPYHNFRRAAHVVAWATHLFERVQDSGAGMSGTVDNGPWFRFTLAIAALIQDCKHSGVADGQLQAEKHMVFEMHGGDKCQAKHALNHGLDVFADEFPELYDEIVWGCPRFVHLLRRTALSNDVSGTFSKAMRPTENSPREVAAKTEAAMALVLRVANLGHFALDNEKFQEWNEAAFAEKRVASLAKRGSDPNGNWHEHCVLFVKGEVIPLVEQCETILPTSTRLLDTVAVNLKNFEAQGEHWADNQIFPRRRAHERSTPNPASTVDIFC